MTTSARRTLDLDRYFPFLLTALSNKWSSAASQLYGRKFGVGVIEWRVISAVAAVPGCRPNDICQLVGIDKGAVAKALKTLEAAGYMTAAANTQDARSKVLEVTDEGWALHDAILSEALARQERLLAPLNAEDRERLLTYLRVLLDHLPAIKADLGAASPAHSPKSRRTRGDPGDHRPPSGSAPSSRR